MRFQRLCAKMKINEVILAYGHENVRATHKSTLEITKEPYLSKRGDCIIAVSANKAVADLSSNFRRSLLMGNVRVFVTIEVEGLYEVIGAFGSPRLILTHPTDTVIRKSSYICSRTLAIQADKAACDLSRELVERLKNPKQEVKITLTVSI